MVEERRELPGVKPTSSGRWWLRNAFWRHLGPMFTIMIARASRGSAVEHRVRSIYDYMIRRWTCMLVGGKATTPHRQIIRHQEKPGPYKFVFSMWSFDETQFFETSSTPTAGSAATRRAHRISLRPAGGRLSHGRGQERAAVLHARRAGDQHRSRVDRGTGLGRVPQGVQRIFQRPQRPPVVQPDKAPDAGAGRQGLRRTLGRVRPGAPHA